MKPSESTKAFSLCSILRQLLGAFDWSLFQEITVISFVELNWVFYLKQLCFNSNVSEKVTSGSQTMFKLVHKKCKLACKATGFRQRHLASSFFCHFSFPIFNCKIVYWENRKVRLVRASIQSDSTLTVLQLLSDFRALVVCPQTMASAEFRARKSNSNSANSAGFFFYFKFPNKLYWEKNFPRKN